MTARGAALLAVTVLAATAAAGDTLVLRNGRRIQGELVQARYDWVEFRGDNGRTERVDRRDVRRIEFDDFGGSGGSFGGGSGSFGGGSGSSGGSSGGGGRPGGMREREVGVPARDAWTRTGIDVNRGQPLYFDARGEIRWGPDRKDGPDGERNSPRNPNRPIPNRNAAALIGRIGNGDPFFIGGDKGELRARDSGPLYLGINDDVLQDNSGSFRVTIAY
jgi:hypothetical protein